ncbi:MULTISPECIES: hypothetical protein [Streptomyces]|uniref:Secreted protein n=1 Tax=Streptomyces sudanensis TaxID=436397 RepID=A0ABY4TC59_9ACTN|nr:MULTISPECIES: hypothetical protein [Streptomyces]MCP9958534.1 hypothetical protein [Streptomyces sudanensis]MCQ0000955.1 hypothetical protein [Streptomyces sudanensis]URN16542.1 hypothetical protein MW084_11990 [Streptomyces sudanensis]
MRHVRAVAVLGVVLVALTGARGSGGGSCGGSSSGSGSGSGSYSDGGSGTGGHGDAAGHGGSGSDSGGSGGSGSGGGSSVPGGSGSDASAMRDIRIAECRLDASGKNLVARLAITNSGLFDHEYEATVQFKGATGTSVPYAVARVDDLVVPKGASKTVEATTAYTGTQNGAEYTQCVVTRAQRTVS